MVKVNCLVHLQIIKFGTSSGVGSLKNRNTHPCIEEDKKFPASNCAKCLLCYNDNITLIYIVLYCIVLYCIVLYCIGLYCIVLYCMFI